MAVTKWASTGLGWGGGLFRLRTRSAAPWAWVSTPKLPPGGIQHCQPASSSSSTRAVLWPYFAASYWQPGGRAPRAPRRAHGSQGPTSTAARPPQYSPRKARTGCSGCCAGGRCAGHCCAGWRAVRPPAAAAPAPSLAGAVAPRAPNSAGTRHASSSLSRGELSGGGSLDSPPW